MWSGSRFQLFCFFKKKFLNFYSFFISFCTVRCNFSFFLLPLLLALSLSVGGWGVRWVWVMALDFFSKLHLHPLNCFNFIFHHVFGIMLFLAVII